MKHIVPKLLVSVRSAEEAVAARSGGADIIDVKEPNRGSLGAADAAVVHEVIECVGAACPVSAALGELVDQPAPLPPSLELCYAKVGLRGAATSDWREQLSALFAAMPQARPVAAAYIDWRDIPQPTPSPREVLAWAIHANAAGLLLDTCFKGRGGLLDGDRGEFVKSIIAEARAAGLFVALAGSLRIESIPEALALNPDIIAVRGAACSGGNRLQRIDAARVRQLAAVIAAHAALPATPAPRPAMSPAG